MKWISVEEKLPKHGTLCIAHCGAWGCHLVVYDETGQSNHWSPTYGCCSYASIIYNLSNITHWMAVPNLTKEK